MLNIPDFPGTYMCIQGPPVPPTRDNIKKLEGLSLSELHLREPVLLIEEVMGSWVER